MAPEPVVHTTVTAALDALGFGRLQWALLAYCGLCWLADACEVMLLSFLGPAVRCAWGIGPGGETALTSVVFLAMLAGVTSLGAISDHLGRRRGFLLSALLLGAAGLASALAPSFGWLLVLRGVVGFALGGTPIAVTLLAEFCSSEGRGKWLLLMQSFWTLGTVLEALIAWAVLPTLGWRWLVGASAVPTLALLALFPWVPESPLWLASKGRHAEAEAVLRRVAAINRRPLHLRLAPSSPRPAAAAEPGDAAQLLPGSSGSALGLSASGHLSVRTGSARARSPPPGPRLASPDAQAPLLAVRPLDAGAAGAAIPAAHPGGAQHSMPSHHRWADALRTVRTAGAVIFGPQLLRTTLILFLIFNCNAITYYGLVLLTTALQTAAKKEECVGGGPNLVTEDFVAILVTALAEAPGVLAAASLIDTKGRKWTLRAALLVCSAAMLSLVAGPPHSWQLPLLFMARASIQASYSTLYCYAPELYPTAVRSIGLALCNGCSRVGGMLAPLVTVYLVAGGHSRASELLLGTLCGGAALCVLWLPYETRGRDLSTELQPDGGSKAPAAARRQGDSGGSSGGGGGHAAPSGSLRAVQVHPSEDGDLELEPTHEHGPPGEGQPLLKPAAAPS